MNIRKLKRSNIKKHKASKPSPRIMLLLDQASSCLEMGRLRQAEHICRQILERSPRTSEACNILGMVYQEQGRIDDAIILLQQAVALDAANANAFFNLGNVLGLKGDFAPAAAAFRKGLSLAPRTANARSYLGLALARLGKIDEAIDSLKRATELDPYYGDAWFNLGDIYYCQGRLQEAVDTYKRCIHFIPDFTEAHFNLSIALHDLKLIPEAVKSLQRTIALDPNHASALHMLSALTGESPDRTPQQAVTKLFDQYADRFDTDLVNRLQYIIPEHLRRLLADAAPPGLRLSKVMDLGCGTGLSGQAFRDIADYLAGIDVSSKMLEQARTKKIYDDLFMGDLCEQLQQLPDLFDMFIAADVMVYIGNLEPLFVAVSNRAQPGAYFAFSIESQQEHDFTLQSTGRYAHAAAYIAKLAAAHDFTISGVAQTGIRKEGDAWIPGEIYLLQKKEGAP